MCINATQENLYFGKMSILILLYYYIIKKVLISEWKNILLDFKSNKRLFQDGIF